MRKIATLIILLLAPLVLWAQGGLKLVTGHVLEADSQQPAIQAAVQFLNPSDSSRVEAAICDLEGRFSAHVPYGNYIVKISTVGYSVFTRNVLLTPSTTDFDLGTILLAPEAQMLQAAVAAAKVEPVTIVGDTVAYNAAAFRVAEDATLEELLKKIPGMEIQGSTVTLQGKPITQIFINGKRFFGNDVKAGLKSLDANMVEQIRAYERESDFTRLTGIDDGETEDVLDIKIKKNMMDGFRGSVTGGYGTENRYVGRGSLNKITKKDQININAGASDIVSQGAFNSTNNNRLGGGSEGNRNTYTAGVTMARSREKTEMSGSVQFLDVNRNVNQQTMSESLSSTIKNGERVFTSTTGDNVRDRHADDGSIKANFNLEYKPTKQFTLIVKPTVQYNYNNAEFDQNSNSYNSSQKQTNNSLEHNDNMTKKIYACVNAIGTFRSTYKRGRSLTGRVQLDYSDYHQNIARDINTHYYILKSKVDPKKDSIRHIDYYQDNGDSFFREIASVSLNEPFAKYFYLQASVVFNAQQFKSNRDIFQPLSTMAFVPDWSYSGTYEYYSVPTTLSVRYARKKFSATAGLKITPQFGTLNYVQKGVWESTRTNVWNFAPDLYLRYIKSKTEKVIFRYSTGQWAQSLYNLIPLENGVPGLSVHKGNADLKPSFKHMLKLSYNKSDRKAQNSILLDAGFDATQNAIANSTEYSEITGARMYVPKNIDGNWNAKANMVFNQTFKKNTHFSMTSNTVAQYNNTCNLLYNSKLKEDEMNISGRFMIRESLDFTYRNEWFEGILNARGDFTSETSQLRPDMNQQPWNICAGAEATFTLPWGMMINLNFSAIVQRGYVFGGFNDQYYYLDTSISQPFFKKKLVLRLEGVNLLDQNVNMVRTFSASSRSVALYNGTGRYIMLSAIFRFKI